MSKRFTVQEAIAPYTKAVIASPNVEYAPCRAIMVNKLYAAEDATTGFTDTDGDGSADVSGTGTINRTESTNNIQNPQLWFTDKWRSGASGEKTTLAITLMADSTIYPFSVKQHNNGADAIIFLY